MSGYEIHVIKRAGHTESRFHFNGGPDSYHPIDVTGINSARDLGRAFEGDGAVAALVSRLQHTGTHAVGHPPHSLAARMLPADEIAEATAMWKKVYDTVLAENTMSPCYIDLDAYAATIERICESTAATKIFGLHPREVETLKAAARFSQNEPNLHGQQLDPRQHFDIQHLAYLTTRLAGSICDDTPKIHKALQPNEAVALSQGYAYLSMVANRCQGFEVRKWPLAIKEVELPQLVSLTGRNVWTDELQYVWETNPDYPVLAQSQAHAVIKTAANLQRFMNEITDRDSSTFIGLCQLQEALLTYAECLNQMVDDHQNDDGILTSPFQDFTYPELETIYLCRLEIATKVPPSFIEGRME